MNKSAITKRWNHIVKLSKKIDSLDNTLPEYEKIHDKIDDEIDQKVEELLTLLGKPEGFAIDEVDDLEKIIKFNGYEWRLSGGNWC